MLRDNRNTGQWFVDDFKPQIQDRSMAPLMGPGKYNTNDNQTKKEKNSFNLGKIPFASGDERFKKDYRAYFKPGPSTYDPSVSPRKQVHNSSLAKNLIETSGISLQSTSVSKLSPRQQEVLEMTASSQFKSKAAKISIYKDEEKRIRLLHGPKKNLKYQIKLNDEILDKHQRAKSQKYQGKVVIGPNFGEEVLSPAKGEEVRNPDLFGVTKKIKAGPADYDPAIQGKSAPAAVIKQDLNLTKGPSGSVKKQMEDYLGNIFDGQTRKNTKSVQPPSTTEPTSLEKMQPFSQDKRDMSFKSKIIRDPLKPQKEKLLNPGPAAIVYDNNHIFNTKKKTQLVQGRSDFNFGSSAERNDLLRRDVALMPFGDPSHLQSPAPVKYQTNLDKDKTKQQILQSVGSSLGVPDPNMNNAFVSPVQRDFMDQISKEAKVNPGPGTYDTQIQDKLKVLNYQLSTRYHLKPFGSGATRFNYQSAKPQNQRQTIDFNQMISVKDKDIMMKRGAFLQTIQNHKKQANSHQNAVFSSTQQRFKNTTPKYEEPGQLYANQPPMNLNKTADYVGSGASSDMIGNQTDRATHLNSQTKSTFGLTFQKNNSSGLQMMERMNVSNQQFQQHLSKDNPNYGFNSTSQRFSYMKEMQKMGENPGPGSYHLNDASTIAGSTNPTQLQMPKMNNGLNTISSAGGFFQQKSSSNHGIYKKSPKNKQMSPSGINKFATIGTSKFMDSSNREDFNHYIPSASNNNIVLQNLGPGSYFKSKSPFLKRSFNASLPQSKFY